MSISERAYNNADISAFDLDACIERISHWLPSQGPLKDFIHHNTLHAVQHHPFHEGIALASGVYGAKDYLPIEDYRNKYRAGKIRDSAIDWAIQHSGTPPQDWRELREELFNPDFPLDGGPHPYPPPFVKSTNRGGSPQVPSPAERGRARVGGIRANWLKNIEINLDSLTHPVIFRLLSTFLDQGISRRTMAKKGESFWECISRLATESLVPLYPFDEPEIKKHFAAPPDQVITSCLERIVGAPELYEDYLSEMLLSHPGWSGMVHVIECQPQALLARRIISLRELIATELLCEHAFLRKKKGPGFPSVSQSLSSFSRIQGDAGHAKRPAREALRVWHEAMEWSLYEDLLFALKQKNQSMEDGSKPTPLAQVLFCIDDRECSLRRHVEAINPSIETFGAPGFFGIDFLFQGLQDAYPVQQCPVMIKPKHVVRETRVEESAKLGFRDLLRELHQPFKPHLRSNSLFRGWLYTQTLGLGYALRLAWQVFRPSAELPRIAMLSEVEAHTELHLLRESEQLTEDGYLLGFSISEMADRIENLMRTIGLAKGLAHLIVLVAHGSSSTNNPHFAAYDCGACSGKPGAPNARAFAWMANHPPVRELLKERGISIPADSHFVAALHNTSRDEITYFDQHLIPQALIHEWEMVQGAMQGALTRNARERCRWFELAPETLSDKNAHDHVKSRATSIFEPRPELNHSNNLLCVVGRRALSRGLFLDRRAFLQSYDPDSDPNGDILCRILSAVLPVCGGINLEYLFSRLDNSIYGAGTKLPHNVIGLLGVANGVEGDLRTGLPSQMIEVHEPARLLIIIDQSREVIDKALAKLGGLREWVDYEWVRLACRDVLDREVYFLAQGDWEHVVFPDERSVPRAASSDEITEGQTETIPPHLLSRSAA
jgi:uncharacterized protein YbcC (UPF0753/DUF2309 family)